MRYNFDGKTSGEETTWEY